MRPRLRKPRPSAPPGVAGPAEREKLSSKAKKEYAADLARAALEQIPRLLLIRLRSLGDAILTLPLVEALHAWRPELRLDILIEAPYAPVFRGHPAVHEVLSLRPRNPPASDGWSRFRAAVEIRKRRYPAALNLHGGTTSMLFTAIAGAKLRIGQKSHRGSRLYNVPIPSSNEIWRRPSIHTAEHQLTLMRWLELPLPSRPAGSLHVDAAAKTRLTDRAARAGISDYVLIQPTATLATKQWSAAKFAELGDQLLMRHGAKIVFVVAPHETAVLEDIRKTTRERHTYWSDLRLDDFFALIAACRLFIGNDSGPTHAAAALGKPLVVVWGSSNFQAWHPWNAAYEAVRSDLPCMPCPGYRCAAFREPKCILDIPVSRVLEACERMLSRTA